MSLIMAVSGSPIYQMVPACLPEDAEFSFLDSLFNSSKKPLKCDEVYQEHHD